MHWFTSDWHIDHKRIIEYSNRPFKDVEEMNETLIANYNSVVRPGDSAFFLGDIFFSRPAVAEIMLRRLHGQKCLIFGNHDRTLRENKDLIAKYFAWARDYAEIKVGEQKIILMHYAMRVWRNSHHGAWQLYGHSHGSLPDDPHSLSMDVGVDPNGYFPLSFDQVKAKMAAKTWQPVDRHGVTDVQESE